MASVNALALVAQTQSLIASGDIAAAEAVLLDLADQEGDGALMLVLEQLPAKDMLAVIREYDNSKESVVGLLITPEQFARAVVIEKQYKDLNHTHLRGMVNAVLFREDADAVEFLNAIGALQDGSEALANYFAEKWSRVEAFARSGSFDVQEDDGVLLPESTLLANLYVKPKVELDEVTDHDWMQVAWLLRNDCPDLFVETLMVLRAKAHAHDQGLLEEEEAKPGESEGGKTPAAPTEEDEESAI